MEAGTSSGVSRPAVLVDLAGSNDLVPIGKCCLKNVKVGTVKAWTSALSMSKSREKGIICHEDVIFLSPYMKSKRPDSLLRDFYCIPNRFRCNETSG